MQFRHQRPRPNVLRNVALIACATLAITACGDDDDAADVTTPETTAGETTEPETTVGDTTEPETTEPETTVGDTTEPTTDDVISEGVVCATNEDGGPLDLDALADLDAASALGEIDGASTFLFVANEADLIDRLVTGEDLTLFVPTDEAFDMIPEDELQPLLSDPLLLSSLVLDHIVLGEYRSEDLEDGMTLPTATEGEQWLVNVTEDGDIMVAGSAATVICPDLPAANAVIHLIDQVIITRAGIG